MDEQGCGSRLHHEQRGEAPVGPAAYRVDVIGRLLERGMTVRALEALLPGWETEIAAAVDAQADAPDQLAPQSGRPV